MQGEPWETYRRNRTWTGWSYPVGRSVVEAALRDAGVRLLSLGLHQADGNEDGRVALLRASRFADPDTTHQTPGRPRTDLVVYAVPSAVRARAGAALVAGRGLRDACAWLAAAEAAHPTWRDKSQYRLVYLCDGELCVHELEW